MVNLLIFFLLIGIQVVLSQHEVKKTEPPAPQGCCNLQPVDYRGRQLYIPPVFTPNGDGFNDRFIPRSDNPTLLIRDFMILSADGDSVVFFRSRIDYSDRRNGVDSAWNGLRNDGTRYQGRFKYRLTIGNQPTAQTQLVGEACALRCRSGGRVLQSKEDCFYAD